MAAFSWFRALRNLDLQVVRVHQVIGSDAEASRGDLLDRASPQITVCIGLEPRFILSTLAGIGSAADPVHSDCQSLVRFLADRAERHRSSGKTLHNFSGRLDSIERNP